MSETIADNSEQQRYEVSVDGEVAGFARYKRGSDQIAFTHTEIDDRFEGQGLGSKLISFALDEAREHELAVLPFCPFVKTYIQRHREYVGLVPAERRAEFDL
jgi:predicted GNAT family acetyltransferase